MEELQKAINRHNNTKNSDKYALFYQRLKDKWHWQLYKCAKNLKERAFCLGSQFTPIGHEPAQLMGRVQKLIR